MTSTDSCCNYITIFPQITDGLLIRVYQHARVRDLFYEICDHLGAAVDASTLTPLSGDYQRRIIAAQGGESGRALRRSAQPPSLDPLTRFQLSSLISSMRISLMSEYDTTDRILNHKGQGDVLVE